MKLKFTQALGAIIIVGALATAKAQVPSTNTVTNNIPISNNLFSSGSIGNMGFGTTATYNNPTSWTTVSTGGCFSLYNTNGYVTNAPSGANIIESFSNTSASAAGGGRVYQTVSGYNYIAGDTYSLSALIGNDNGNSSQIGVQLLLWNSTSSMTSTNLASLTVPTTTNANHLTQYSLNYTASNAVNGTPIVLGINVPAQTESFQAWTAFTDFVLTQVTPGLVTYYWSNAAVDGNLSNGANWGGGNSQTNGTQLVFGASPSITTLTNTSSSETNGSLTFSNNAPAYTIGGNTLTLAGSGPGIYNNSSNTQTINLPIANPSGLALTTTNGGGNLVINGAVSGAGGVTASGTGTATLAGANTYSGATAVSGGALVLSGSLTNSSVSVTGATFSESSGGSISGTGGFTQSGSSTSTLSGTNSFAGARSVSGGSYTENSGSSLSSGSGISISAGSALLAGNNTNVTGASSLTGSGNLTLQANSNNTVGGISYALSRENSGFTFQGSGTLKLLSDSNVTFAGGNNTAINAAGTTLSFFVDQLTTGNSNNIISFAPGGIAQIANTTFSVSGSTNGYTLALPGINVLTAAGAGYQNMTVNANGANFQFGGVTNSLTLTVGGSGNTTFTGVINSGTVTKSGSGTLIFTGTNTFNSGTTISSGAVQVSGAGNLGSGSYSGTIANSGQFIYSSSANQTLGGVISGSGGLTDLGTGTLTLNAADTFTGTTTIGSGAKLLLGSSGSLASTNINLGTSTAQGTFDVSSHSAYTLATNQTLNGYGTVALGTATLTLNGNLTPGAGISTYGIISFSGTGNLVLGSTHTTTLKVSTNSTPGTTYDQVSIPSGNLTLGGVLDIAVNSSPGTGTFDLFSASSFTGNPTSVALTGSWDPGSFTETSGQWTYTDTNSNTYDFSPANGTLIIAVPEPSMLGLLGVGLVLGIVARRKILRKEANIA